MAKRAEKHYGCPQDIEWAIDRHLPGGGERRPAAEPARDGVVTSHAARIDPGGSTAIEGIVSTLLAAAGAKK
jgi:pyruvate, water dikinase